MSKSDRPETIAWAVIESGECQPLALFTSRADAELHASRKNDIGLRNCESVPLYTQPTLTGAERESLVAAIRLLEHSTLGSADRTRIGLLSIYRRFAGDGHEVA
jgi:hypothetical protein